MDKTLTPAAIVSELNKYIVGQQEAKRNVAIALRNRWRRMNVNSEIQQDIMPNNILMIGATGVGKTEVARRLAKVADAPFIKVEASKFTEVGYVGRDVESMVRDLVEHAVAMVKAKKQEEVKEQASQIVENIILDALIPPIPRTNSAQGDTSARSFDSTEEGENLNEKTRELFRNKIRNGDLDHRKIETEVSQSNKPGIGIVGGGMLDEASIANLQELLHNILPKRTKKREVTIAEAKKLLLEEESAKLIDMEVVKEEALQKAQNSGIIFIDEIDKIAASSHKGGGPDVSREGVQRDLLPIVEGSAVTTKYGTVQTNHILFIAAGAFHVAKPSDLIPELQGRFPIRVELDSLTKEDFYRILKEPKNALTKQYIALFEAEGVSITFTDEAIEEIAATAFIINQEVENIGARRLHTVMSRLLNNFLFDVPEKIEPGQEIAVTHELVKERLMHLTKSKSISEYIL